MRSQAAFLQTRSTFERLQLELVKLFPEEENSPIAAYTLHQYTLHSDMLLHKAQFSIMELQSWKMLGVFLSQVYIRRKHNPGSLQ